MVALEQIVKFPFTRLESLGGRIDLRLAGSAGDGAADEAE